MRHLQHLTTLSTLALATIGGLFRAYRAQNNRTDSRTMPLQTQYYQSIVDNQPLDTKQRYLQTHHLLNIILIFSIGVCIIHLVTQLVSYLPNHMAVWDDALFFYRYAYNLQTHGQAAWNIAQGPAYGSTELLYMVYVWFISLFTGLDAPQLTLQIASLSSGLVFLGLVILMVWRLVALDFTRKLIALFIVVMGLAYHATNLTQHFITGMGTTFVMAYFTAYLLTVIWHTRHRSRTSLIFTALWGGMAYSVRPDLLIFSGLIAIAIFKSAKTPVDRRRAFALGILTVIVVIAQLIFAQVYFGSALPLPFYAKATPLYGETWMYHLLAQHARDQIGIYIGSNGMYIVIIVVTTIIMPLQVWRRWGALGVAISLGIALHSLYYTYFVAQLMFYYQRFYYPTLPAIVFVACGAVHVLLTDVWALYRINLHKRVNWRIAGILGVSIAAAIFTLPWQNFLDETITTWQSNQGLLVQPPQHEWAEDWSRHWFRIREFATISPNLIVATTEVGIPAVINYDWFVLDLSGLNTTEIAHSGFSADRLFLFYQPDLIYMPFSLYTPMRDAILVHPTFNADYDYYTVDQIAEGGNIAGMDIAIRRSSPHYDAMTAIMNRAFSAISP